MLANKNYNNSNFSGALKLYNKSEKFLSGSNLDFNLGNTYYKIGEKQQKIQDKINLYIKSIEKYKKILINNNFDKEENIDVVFNYVFVKNKLEKIEKEKKDNEEKQKKEEQKKKEEQDKQKQNNEEQNEEKKSENNKGNSENEENNDKKELGGMKESENIKDIQLSDQEIIDISNYINKLNEEEKYNRSFYNNFGIQFQNNTQLNNNLNESEKDW
ncbi:MAG: hypothetical protein Q8K30_06525 [Candidatus Gracilibacteria bacterium]|nr:hypothetical protein [Candidatus Gracilibacteria bacterium]